MRYQIYLFINHIIRIVFLIWILHNSAFAMVTSEPRLSVGSMFTDNIDLTADNEEHDYITSFSPEINLTVEEQLSMMALFYSPTYASYLRFPENNTLRHNAAIDLSKQITRTTRLEFGDTYLYTEDPIYDTIEPFYDIDTTTRQGREPYSINTTSLGLTNQFGPENSVALDYEYYFSNYRDSLTEDRDIHHPALTLNYWMVPGIYGLESEISYIKRNFDDSEDYDDTNGRIRLIRRLTPHFEIYAEYNHELTNYATEGEDYQVYNPLVGFMWDEYSNARFSASFGYFFRDNELSENSSGTVGTIETNFSWVQGTTLSISGAAGYNQASFGAENLEFNKFYTVSGIVEYPISRFLFVNISVDYRQEIYTDVDPQREDSLWRTGAGLAFHALPWMVLNLNYVFQDLDSNININDYTENRAMLTVTLNPRQPLILMR